ncbi:hypothetical protein MNB_SV-15-977 [hydrothermal vent metagenome]|uniref:Lipoprotein n=1 Tax=hydrothermal vent metagenome TaxID=652676 RepID=A0A1W1EKL0_9ZZZZ
MIKRYIYIAVISILFIQSCATTTTFKSNNKLVEEPRLVCGNSEFTHTIYIKRRKNRFDIMAKVDLNPKTKKSFQKNILIASIPYSKANRVFFSQNRLKVEIEADEVSGLYLYFQKDKKYGFLGEISSKFKNEKFIFTLSKNSDSMI